MRENMGAWGSIAVGLRLTRPDTAFFWSWTDLITNWRQRGGDTILPPATEFPHSCACNIVADHFMQTKCDSLLFVDDDMVFDPTTVNDLRDDVEGQSYDILSALYCGRRTPFRPIVITGWTDGGGPIMADSEALDGSVIPVRMVGFGFTLIRRHVIEKLLSECGGEHALFRFDSKLGEDGDFSERARLAGSRVGVHTGVSVGHRATLTVQWNKETKSTKFSAYDFGVK